MNKLLLIGVVAASSLAITSCSGDSENRSSTISPINAYNLFVPASGDGDVYTGLALYKFVTTFPEATIQLGVDNMTMPGGGNTSFSTISMPIASAMVSVDDSGREVIIFGDKNPGESGAKISNLSGSLTQAVYFPPNVSVPGYKLFIPGNSLHYVLMQYELNNDWNIRTFWPDMTFRGSTVTSYPGMTEAYSNSNIAYRVVMQLKDNALTDKADVIFYNAKFAPKAPEITVVLKNLDLAFSDKGYTVKGSDIIPYMVEAGTLQETPKFKFNSFALTAIGDMSTAMINYEVADVYKGTFTGNSVVKPSSGK